MLWSKRNKTSSRNRLSDNYPKPTLSNYSYHQSRSETKVDSERKKFKFAEPVNLRGVRKLWLEKFGFIILGVVVVICLISVLYLSSTPNIILRSGLNNPIYTGNLYSLKLETSKLLSSSLLNNNKITVNTSKIKLTLANDFPMFSSIDLALPLIDHHPIIYLDPATPDIMMTNSAGRYLVNPTGQIMARSMLSSSFKTLSLPILSYPANGYANIGSQVLTSTEVQFIETVYYELSAKGQTPTTMSLVQGSFELNVYQSQKTYYIKFNLESNDPKEQVGSYLATQNYLESQNITPSQYIDVQSDGRSYYQ